MKIAGAEAGFALEKDLAGDPAFGIEGLAFSPNDRVLAGCGRDGYLCLWDVESGRLLRTYRSSRHRLWSVSFSPDGRELAACGHDGEVEIWDANASQDHETAFCRSPSTAGPRRR